MAVAQKKRRKAKTSEESWSEIFDEWNQSGISAEEYCEKEGYSFWGFEHYYEKQFGKKPEVANRKKPAIEPLFIPLGVADLSRQANPKTDCAQSSKIEIVSGNRAFAVQVKTGFDPSTLRQVLEVLGGM